MKKKILTVALCLAALLTFGAISVMAAEHVVVVGGVEYTITMPNDYTPASDVVQYGHCGRYTSAEDEKDGNPGENVYWELVPNEDTVNNVQNNGLTINIWGEGDILYNKAANGDNVGYSSSANAKWAANMKRITRAVIGDNIVSVGSAAFVMCSNLASVELGSSVATLGSASFEGCTNLTTIYRKGTENPAVGTFDFTGIRSFSAFIFDGCRYVENIILPTEGSYELPMEFLKRNEKLKEIYIPAACKRINLIAFRNCSALKNVYIEGDTVLCEGDTEKDKGFYAYSFHNCGEGTDGESRTLAISALPGSNAHEYITDNESVTLVYSKSTDAETGVVTENKMTQNITYIEPCKITVNIDGVPAFEENIVKGFRIADEYTIGNSAYVLFSDDTYTSVFNGAVINGNIEVHAKKLLEFIGYMVRVKDYHGLRAMYEYDTNAFSELEGYTVKEVGALGTDLYGIDPVITLDYPGVKKMVIYKNGGTLVGALSEPVSEDGIATFSSTAVDFGDKDGGELLKSRVGTEMLFRAYVTIENTATGETQTFYSIQGRKDITEACKATAEQYGSELSGAANSFVNEIVKLGVDVNYIYTRDEAMSYLEKIYETDKTILSGQHIASRPHIVKDALNDILEATGELPAVLGYDFGTSSREADYGDEFNDSVTAEFIEYAKQGGLITVSAHMTNPLTNSNYRKPYLSEAGWNALMDARFWSTLIDNVEGNATAENGIITTEAKYIEGLDEPVVLITDEEKDIDPKYEEGIYYPSLADGATAVTDDQAKQLRYNWISQLEDYATVLQRFEDAGVPIFFRPFHETNGNWFWFCGGSMVGSDIAARFRTLWEYVYKYFTYEKGLDNLIWIYSPNITDDEKATATYDVMKFYPGDDYVDIMGLDWYEGGKTPAEGEETGSAMKFDAPSLIDTNKKKTNVWAKLSGNFMGSSSFPTTSKMMPVVYGEFGPSGNLINADPVKSFNGEDVLQLVKDVEDSGRRFAWMLLWSGWTGNPLSIQMMDKGSVFMASDLVEGDKTSFEVLTLAESRTLLHNRHYEQ